MSDWSVTLFNLYHLTVNNINKYLQMGKHQGQNNARGWAQPTCLGSGHDSAEACPALPSTSAMAQTTGQGSALPIWIFITVFPAANPDSRKSLALHSPRLGPVLPALVLGEPALTVPAATQERVLSFPAGQLGVDTAPGEQPGPMDSRAVETGMAQGQRRGGRSHCSLGDQPCGHQQDSAAHTGSRPREEGHMTRYKWQHCGHQGHQGGKPFKHLEGDIPPQLTLSTWMSGPKYPLRHSAEQWAPLENALPADR